MPIHCSLTLAASALLLSPFSLRSPPSPHRGSGNANSDTGMGRRDRLRASRPRCTLSSRSSSSSSSFANHKAMHRRLAAQNASARFRLFCFCQGTRDKRTAVVEGITKGKKNTQGMCQNNSRSANPHHMGCIASGPSERQYLGLAQDRLLSCCSGR